METNSMDRKIEKKKGECLSLCIDYIESKESHKG